MNKKLILIIFVMVLSIKSVLAYIDAGTGGIIISSLWALIVTIFSTLSILFIKIFWNPIKKLFVKKNE